MDRRIDRCPHAYSPSEGILRSSSISPISGKTDKNINAIAAIGDTLVVSTDFGLSMYNLARGEFGDTFTRFGTLATNVNVILSFRDNLDRQNLGSHLGRCFHLADRICKSREPKSSLPPMHGRWKLSAERLPSRWLWQVSPGGCMPERRQGSSRLTAPRGSRSRTCREIHYCAKAGSSTLVLCTSAREVWTVDQANNAQQQRNRPSFCANIHHDRL